MIRAYLAFLGAALTVLTTPAATAQSREEAKAEGKAFAEDAREKAKAAATSAPDPGTLPNYDPDEARDLQTMADDPARIEAAARSSAPRHQGYRAVKDSLASRARFEPSDIEAVIARAGAVSDTPLDYTSGMAIGGSQGTCVPLPPGSGTAGIYMATCNTGYTAEEEQRLCTVPLEETVVQQPAYQYLCSDFGEFNLDRVPWCERFAGSDCRVTGYRDGFCLRWGKIGKERWCSELGDIITELTCSAPVEGQTPYNISNETLVTTARNESQCSPLAANADCTRLAETCSDSDPVTRAIGGVAVTRPCWAWEQSYSCIARQPGNDCSELEASSACRFLREDCLTEDAPCSTLERVYECPLPAAGTNATQYVCDGDVYCIDGSCETITRSANDEFKHAATALHAMNEARGQFDPSTLTLFKGTRNTCSSKVFGVLNCCKGKGFALIPGISLLVALGCNREEVLLHERDANGLCAYVGTYCSKKFLGVCLTKTKAYCCFESKLSRILQEQGRKQLPKPWAKPKEETCQGFTLGEFARLDLSRMDFSEVYAEFTDAARLPDELETSTLIQQKIEDYYARQGQ